MSQVSKDALQAIVEECGIYGTLTLLVDIMIQKGRKDPSAERRALAKRVAESIRRARDAT